MKPIPTERRKRILKDINKWNDHSRRSKMGCLDFLHRQTQTPCPGNRLARTHKTKTPNVTLEKIRDVPPKIRVTVRKKGMPRLLQTR